MSRARVVHAFRPRVPSTIALEVVELTPRHPLFRDGAHARDFHVLMVLTAASGTHEIDGTVVPGRAGQAVLFFPHRLHDATNLREARGWLVVFEAHALDEADRALRLARHVGRADGPAGVFELDADRLAAWTGWLAAQHDEAREARAHFEPAVRAYLRLMLVDLARLSEPGLASVPPGSRRLLERVFAFIDAHYHEGISLADVATHVHRSRGHVAQTVKAHTGRTVLGWIVARRVEEARRRLLVGEAVADVALAVGYEDTAHFIEQFRRATGRTPAQWRRAAR